MHGSVVGVGRVVTSLDKSEERMTVRRVESKVADQTELMKEMEAES
jgi:hypothetical protein